MTMWILVSAITAAVCLGLAAGTDYPLPDGCPDPEICARTTVVCDTRLIAQCWDGTIAPMGAGPFCCCSVCYRGEGARCNNVYRICRPDLKCQHGHCRPKKVY